MNPIITTLQHARELDDIILSAKRMDVTNNGYGDKIKALIDEKKQVSMELVEKYNMAMMNDVTIVQDILKRKDDPDLPLVLAERLKIISTGHSVNYILDNETDQQFIKVLESVYKEYHSTLDKQNL